MLDTVIGNIKGRFKGWNDLVSSITEEVLDNKPDIPKSKSLKEHLWCVVGARESYIAAIKAGQWQGFTCSLKEVNLQAIGQALIDSSTAFEAMIGKMTPPLTEVQEELLINLLEHEVMHEGQVIRLIYGMNGTLPQSWKWA